MKRVSWWRVLLLLLSLPILASCARGEEATSTHRSENEPIHLVATTSIMSDIVRQVAGDEAVVNALIPVGMDPHSFEVQPRELASLSGADLVFVSGLALEGSLGSLLENSVEQSKIISLSAGIHPLELPHLPEFEEGEGESHEHGEAGAVGEEEHAHEPHAGETHVWLDPSNVIAWVHIIEDALSELDPQNAVRYRQRAEAYTGQLEELDRWIEEQVATVPPQNRRLVTDHQVFGAFAARYGFEEVGTIVVGMSTAEEPSARELASLLDRIREAGVSAIFVGNTVNPNLADVVARDSGATVHRLYTDSLSSPEGPAATYIEYMRYNVRTIVDALGGDAS